MFGPANLEEAKRYRYGRWAGDWDVYRYSFCAADINTMHGRQCRRKPGYGPDKIFCKQHASMLEEEK